MTDSCSDENSFENGDGESVSEPRNESHSVTPVNLNTRSSSIDTEKSSRIRVKSLKTTPDTPTLCWSPSCSMDSSSLSNGSLGSVTSVGQFISSSSSNHTFSPCHMKGFGGVFTPSPHSRFDNVFRKEKLRRKMTRMKLNAMVSKVKERMSDFIETVEDLVKYRFTLRAATSPTSNT